MNTFRTEHIDKLLKAFEYKKLGRISGVSLDNIDEKTNLDNTKMSIFHAGNMIFNLILTIVILCLTIYIIKGPLKCCSCETTRKRRCNAESIVDLPSTIPTPVRKKSPIQTKKRQEFETMEMTKRPQKAEEGV